MKRIIALFLALCLVMTVFAACGKEIDNPDPSNTLPVPANTGDLTVPNVPDNTPDSPDNTLQPSVGETWNGIDISFVKEKIVIYQGIYP